MVGSELPAENGVARLELPDVLGGLRVAGWVARSAGFKVALIVGDHSRLSITPENARKRVQQARALLREQIKRELGIDLPITELD